MKKRTEKIIGRDKEKEILKEMFRSKRAEFLAIYGRRRIGKTYLIRNFVHSTDYIFFHMTGIQGGSLKDQLEEFAKQIGVTFYRGAPIALRTRWKDGFEDLNQAISNAVKNKIVVLFFDEFPWMATPRSKLVSSLELYWNRYWCFDQRIKLIVCGSATSWIIENIINNKGGLHNRVTRTLKLMPFFLHEVQKFLEERNICLNHQQILDLYFVIGGVPLYWSFVRKGFSAHQSVDEICFQKEGALTKEFQRLFSSLFEDERPYTTLIRIIASHRYGIGQAELISKSELPDGGNTVRKLHDLEEAGFITSLVPYGHREKGVYYLIDDEYSLFYLHWIEPNLKSVNKRAISKGFWVSQSNQPSWKSWAGLAFESICYKHIDQIRRALDVDPGAIVGAWRYSPKAKSQKEGAQIDLLFDRPDGAITVCEIKYSGSSFRIDKACAQNLMKKLEVFRKQTRTKKQIFLSMITTFGLKPTIYSEEIVVSEVTLDDLFQEPRY